MNDSKEKKDDFTSPLVAESLGLYALFFPLFYLLESTLKRRLYNQLKNKLGKDWFMEQLAEGDSLFDEERKLILRRKPKNFVLKDEGLLVESGLGFWVEFFNKDVYKTAKGAPIGIFKNLPADIKRKDIYQTLDHVKEFRNQLVHSRIAPVTGAAGLPVLQEMKGYASDLELILNWFGGLPMEIVDTRELRKKIDLFAERIKEF